MAPAATHVLFKRGEIVATPAFIAIVVSVVAVFGIVIFIAWRAVKQTPRSQPSERIKPSRSVQRRRAGVTSSPSETSMREIYPAEPSYPQLVYSSRTKPANQKPAASHLHTVNNRGRIGDPPKHTVVKFADAEKSHDRVDHRSERTFVPHRRSADEETASIYSSMSAPLEHNEALFRAHLMRLDRSVPFSTPTASANMPVALPAAVVRTSEIRSRVESIPGASPSSIVTPR